ncbi:MAG: branched-chain amino acid ABC transporter permease, partial [Rhodobacteraceae bacterium]|nr:branched-chain amino acid ABC transporter permease [Paracoccaceae bacterium]
MDQTRNILYFVGIAALIIITGMVQSWNSALLILNMGLISAVMALGVNLQWGFAGLFNVGVMGFVALGGLAAVLVSTDPVSEAWNAGGLRILFALAVGVGIIGATIIAYRRITATRPRVIAMVTILGLGFFAYRALLDPAVEAVEAVNPALQGNLGGLDLPIILAWPVGGLFAAGAAWIIGKAALGLRSDYLAIATLGISEIIIAILKNEDWLARGVKNVIGLDRPVPKEIDLQESAEFIERASGLGLDPVTASALFVKLNYALLFSVVLIILLIMAQLSLKSPWGRM